MAAGRKCRAVEAPLDGDGAAGLDLKDARDGVDKASRHPEGHHVDAREDPREAQLEVRRWDLNWDDIQEEVGPSLEAVGNKEGMTTAGVRSRDGESSRRAVGRADKVG